MNSNENTCVMCDTQVPEGRQVCINCEEKVKSNEKYKVHAHIVGGQVLCASQLCFKCAYKEKYNCKEITLSNNKKESK